MTEDERTSLAWTDPESSQIRVDGEPAGAGEIEEPAPSVGHIVSTLLSRFRFATERPSSLRDHILWALHGEWTLELHGWRRGLELAHAYVVAIPVSVVCALAMWQTARRTRNLTCLGVELTLSTVLNHLPYAHWVVPDVVDVTTWWSWAWSLLWSLV